MDLTDKLHLYNTDNMEFMATIPDKYYNLAIVDPPYGIDFAKQHTGKRWIVREKKDWDKTPPDFKYFKELFRISQNQIICGANYFTEFLPHSQGWVFWDKGQRDFSLADGELIFTSFNKALRVFEFSRGAMQAEYGSKKFHPTTKPVALYKWLLSKYAKQGDKIFDSHLGSMSIAIACHDYGFDLTGCELDVDYYNQAIERVKRHIAQPVLFQAELPESESQLTLF